MEINKEETIKEESDIIDVPTLDELEAEKVEEKPKKPKAKRKQKKETVELSFDPTEYFETFYDDRQQKQVTVFKHDYTGKQNHRIRCKIQAARHYDVPIKHLEDAYFKLNSKKIDNLYINDLIDRHGFNNGVKMSRTSLCAKYDLPENPMTIDIADEKLQSILKKEDVVEGYNKYIGQLITELERSSKERAVFGG
jgi:hypothetical protein